MDPWGGGHCVSISVNTNHTVLVTVSQDGSHYLSKVYRRCAVLQAAIRIVSLSIFVSSSLIVFLNDRMTTRTLDKASSTFKSFVFAHGFNIDIVFLVSGLAAVSVDYDVPGTGHSGGLSSIERQISTVSPPPTRCGPSISPPPFNLRHTGRQKPPNIKPYMTCS